MRGAQELSISLQTANQRFNRHQHAERGNYAITQLIPGKQEEKGKGDRRKLHTSTDGNNQLNKRTQLKYITTPPPDLKIYETTKKEERKKTT